MKRVYKISLLLVVVLITACEPTTNLYKTPPLYYCTGHDIPSADKIKTLQFSVAAQIPLIAGLKIEYRADSNWSLFTNYKGNLGLKSNYSAWDFDFRYQFNSYNIGGAYIIRRKNKNLQAFVSAGIGLGRSLSVVPEINSPVLFNYKGRFSHSHLTIGFMAKHKKGATTLLSSRNSYVYFREYELPGSVYTIKAKFLSDVECRYAFPINKQNTIKAGIYLGGFLNGMNPGDRSVDQKPDVWRIDRFCFGAELFFSIARKH